MAYLEKKRQNNKKYDEKEKKYMFCPQYSCFSASTKNVLAVLGDVHEEKKRERGRERGCAGKDGE